MVERDKYQKMMNEQYEQRMAELDAFKLKAKGLSDEAQAEAHKYIQTLETNLKESRVKMEELAESTGEAWESVRHSVDSALATLKTGFQEAADKLRSR